MARNPPQLERVLETVLYFEDEDATHAFYSETLGLGVIAREPGRNLFYRAGSSVFLLFRAAASLEPGSLPPHGAKGPIHTCFLAAPGDYEAWKRRLESKGVAILREVDWPGGARSFYFADPSGNLLEIASGDLWAEWPGRP